MSAVSLLNGGKAWVSSPQANTQLPHVHPKGWFFVWCSEASLRISLLVLVLTYKEPQFFTKCNSYLYILILLCHTQNHPVPFGWSAVGKIVIVAPSSSAIQVNGFKRGGRI